MKLYLLLALCGAAHSTAQISPGSIYSDQGRYGDLTSDMRARRVGDIVTILVSDRMNASTQGSSKSARSSSANASIPRLLGQTSPVGALANLTNLQSETALDGTGTTNRSNVFTTTLSGRVVEVLPNGDLVIQADKDVGVNSEKHQVTIRGIVRWNDLNPTNQIRSDRIAMMKIQLNGKGIVSDAIRRPNILYRILMGLLPF